MLCVDRCKQSGYAERFLITGTSIRHLIDELGKKYYYYKHIIVVSPIFSYKIKLPAAM